MGLSDEEMEKFWLDGDGPPARVTPTTPEGGTLAARSKATLAMVRGLGRRGDHGGPEAATVRNAAGGEQADNPFAMHLLPQWAILEVARLMGEAAVKYGTDNWRLIDSASHLDHAQVHAFLHQAGDEREGRLGHLVRVATRALMALEQALVEGELTDRA